ncbi:Lsr2 family protein [Nocardia sp. NPDC005978]
MVKKLVVTLIDDLDPSRLANETVEFGLDGITYQIDLSTDNAERLRNLLRDWVAHATRTVGPRRRPSRTSSSAVTRRSRHESEAIRRWARANGVRVSARGRIAQTAIEAYQRAADPDSSA